MIPAYEFALSVLNFVLLECVYGQECEYYYIEKLPKAAYINCLKICNENKSEALTYEGEVTLPTGILGHEKLCTFC
jgi:hypothetical protein